MAARRGRPKRARWEKFLPQQIRLPGGYEVKIRVVSGRYLSRLAERPSQGLWVNFGVMPGPAKVGYIYIDRELSKTDFTETLGHEVHHAVTDWSAEFSEDVKVKLEE